MTLRSTIADHLRRRWWPHRSRVLAVWVFLAVLSVLLAGYMFLGRGFAHLGFPPLYVGEAALLIGLICTGIALDRSKLSLPRPGLVWLLVGFMALGLARTVPYLGVHGIDSLRDAVLWGYALFALMIYLLAGRALAVGGMRLYGWLVPLFAVWLPISFNIFVLLAPSIDPNELGSNVPLVFFKSGDMAVHIVGSIAFLVLGATAITNPRSFIWRAAIAVPLLWTAFVAGATNRGGLVTVAIGLVAIAAVAPLLRRARNWLPVVVAPAALALLIGAGGLVGQLGMAAVTPGPDSSAIAMESLRPSPSARSPEPTASPTSDGEDAAVEGALVTNSGFELGSPGDGNIEGWGVWAGAYGVMGDGAYRGAQFASVQNTGSAYTAAITSTEFPFRAGDHLAITLRIKAITGSPKLEIYVNWYDRGGDQISSDYVSRLESGGITMWQEVSGIVAAPAQTSRAQIILYEAAGNATMGIDEVIVAAGDFSTGSLVTNPGFELGTSGDGRIGGWGVWAGTYAIIADDAYRGGKLASMQNTGDAYSAALTSARFPFEAGDDLGISLRVKAIAGSPTLEIYVNWHDRSGNQLSSDYVSRLESGGVTTWQEVSGIVTAPGDTVRAQIVLYEATGQGATLGIDEVIVEAGDFSTGSLVTNPGFELGTPGDGRIGGWAIWAGAYDIVADDPYRGDKLASMQNTGDAYSAALTSAPFPFEAGDDLAVSLRVKAITASPTLEIYVNWFDRAGEQIASVYAGLLDTEGVRRWQEASGVLTAPPDTARAEIVLYEATGRGATVGVDEVIVEAGDFIPSQPALPPDAGRPATIEQIIENITSIFGSSDDVNLEGTRAFRLRWWTAIVQYTVFGEHFWSGKGFGVNLADDDGFQANVDRSLRAPHNSHMTVLARMGVPGFVLWLLLQGAFGIGLLRSVLAHRRVGDTGVAAVGAWILVYWVAMMVNTSFDPYLEGPQGGIWFWSLFGLGLVVMRLEPRQRET